MNQSTNQSINDSSSFQNHDVGTWHGTGLHFAKDGEKVLNLTRPTYNASRASLQFPGVGAQVSLCIPDRLTHPSNLSAVEDLSEPPSDQRGRARHLKSRLAQAPYDQVQHHPGLAEQMYMPNARHPILWMGKTFDDYFDAGDALGFS